MRNTFKSTLLLTTSLLFVFSTETLATTVAEEVQSEFSSNQVSQKIWNTNDYLLHLDVTEEANKIGNKVKNITRNRLPLATLQTEAKNAILAELTATHQELRANGGSKQIGKILFTLNRKHDDLSVAFHNTPLVYPCIYASDREKSNAFLPRNFQTHFTGRHLYDYIKEYTKAQGLSTANTDRLYKYLEPLFYIVQMEISPMLEGGKTKSLYQSPRWVYTKSYEQMQESVQRQAEHHLAMLKKTPIAGLDEDYVRSGLTEHLLDLGLALLPDPNRVLHQNKGMVYVLGRNLNEDISLIHPYADNLPYPVLQEHRLKSRANIPYSFERTPASYKQLQRTDQFVEWSDYHFSDQEKRSMKWLMEGIGALFHKHLSTFHVKQFPVDQQSMDLTKEMALSFVNNQTIPEPYLTQFYQRDIDPDIHHVLSGIKNKGDTHRSLTSDLWPARFKTEEGKTALVNESIKFLLFQDILDRYEAYKAHYKPSDVRFHEITRDLDFTALKDDKGKQTESPVARPSFPSYSESEEDSESFESYPLKMKYLSSVPVVMEAQRDEGDWDERSSLFPQKEGTLKRG